MQSAFDLRMRLIEAAEAGESRERIEELKAALRLCQAREAAFEAIRAYRITMRERAAVERSP